ncbi:MAG: phosphoribosylglycinamide formyltransferase [Candidatus Omnitrophica bacterium]|nr:phosphoribosylglycinamide formyltransferase [Candidatus Omnitrophota bacterium]
MQGNVAVLCSGQGTNLQAILDAIRQRTLHAQICVVVSDREGALALKKARRAGIPAVYLNPNAYSSREEYDQALVGVLRRSGAHWIALAGFMRILTPGFVRAFRNRILNIHPALLPAFRGAHAVADALKFGAKVTGVTVHLVDDHVDHGPVVAQAPVEIRSNDTPASLLKRVHRVEHALYPQAIQWAVSGRLKIRGRRVNLSSRKP